MLHSSNNNRKNSLVHLISHDFYFTSPISSEQRYISENVKAFEAGIAECFYRPPNIRNIDTIIYVIGEDTPIQYPLYESVKIDVQWHANRIDFLKSECFSMVILIANSRYKELSSFDITKNDMQPIIVSYFSGFIFSLAFAAAMYGLICTYFR